MMPAHITDNITSITLPCHPVVIRYSNNGNDSLSLFFINSSFQHYIIEDEFRTEKVKGETRIPAGIYPLSLRTEGGFHERFINHKDQRIRKMHEGMIWIQNVPGFDFILYHTGNTEKDTEGCLLCGDKINNNVIAPGFLEQSVEAYVRTYPRLLNYIKKSPVPVIQLIDLI